MRKPWTKADIKTLRARYPHESTKALAAAMGRSLQSIYSMADILDINKTAAYMESDRSGRIMRGVPRAMVGNQFKKGLIPWNKGKKLGKEWGLKTKATQFQKGNKPHNHKQVGSTRYSKDGYHETKVAEPRYWKQTHIILWETMHGPVPASHMIIFADGNKKNLQPENLKMIKRSENMLRNTIHRYPPEVKSAIHTLSKLKRTIHAKEQN